MSELTPIFALVLVILGMGVGAGLVVAALVMCIDVTLWCLGWVEEQVRNWKTR